MRISKSAFPGHQSHFERDLTALAPTKTHLASVLHITHITHILSVAQVSSPIPRTRQTSHLSQARASHIFQHGNSAAWYSNLLDQRRFNSKGPEAVLTPRSRTGRRV